MIDTLFPLAIELSKFMLFLAMVVVCIRIVRGPHAGDRVVALDMLCMLGVSVASLAAMSNGAIAFIDVALGIALIGFLATAAFAAFIEHGTKRNDHE